MKKPKWRIYFRLKRNFSLKPYTFINRNLRWKDKFESPRVETVPQYRLSWLWFRINVIQGNDDDWEWYLWVTEYSDNDIQRAIDTFPWSREDAHGNFIKMNPHLNYNKKREE